MQIQGLVYDTFIPKQGRPFWKSFWDIANESAKLDIAVGYVGAASVMALSGYLEANKDFELNLLVGMQYHEGFTRPQLEALKKLTQVQQASGRGKLSVSTRVRHHGKIYMFEPKDTSASTKAYVGSANLEAISQDYNRTFETGVLLSDNAGTLRGYFKDHVEPLGSDFTQLSIEPTLQSKSPLEHFESVNQLNPTTVEQIKNARKDKSFSLPLKEHSKSNLNVFHGEPRKNPRTGRSLPRPWYEAEIIPGRQVTSQPGYPRNQSFRVVTDDGFEFMCRTQGQDSKNFRSADSLSILGAWLKGRLETHGALRVGDLVTRDCLDRYGRRDFEMSYAPDYDVWYLDFSV